MTAGAKFRISDLIGEYDVHLQKVCGVSSGTRLRYTTNARAFLEWKSREEIEVAGICPADLIAFVSEYAFKHAPKTSKLVVSSLRSFLCFLQLKGLCDAQLVRAVPTIPAWRLSSLPTCLSESDANVLLCTFDRTTKSGLRGYAIAQCMLVLGLRAGEVARLSLDDIDWDTGIIGIPRTKSRRVDRLPLPTVVGDAIVDYLRDGRPPTPEREVFVRYAHSSGDRLSSSAISQIIRRAFHRTGLNSPSKGSHILRHTAAARMIRTGASLKEVSDVLRHRHIDTTMIYSKVDITSLREVAMPWPEARP